MSSKLLMLLSWVRKDSAYRLIAWGYMLGTSDLEDWERQYFMNIHNAIISGVSA